MDCCQTIQNKKGKKPPTTLLFYFVNLMQSHYKKIVYEKIYSYTF